MNVDFFSLISPLIMPLVAVVAGFSTRMFWIVIGSIVLEVEIAKKLLHKTWFPLAFQLLLIDTLVTIAQIGLMIITVMSYWKILGFLFPGATPQELSTYSNHYGFFFVSVFGVCFLLFIRWKLFCKIYEFFDKQMNQKIVSKAMMYVVVAGYVYNFVLIKVNNFGALPLNL